MISCWLWAGWQSHLLTEGLFLVLLGLVSKAIHLAWSNEPDVSKDQAPASLGFHLVLSHCKATQSKAGCVTQYCNCIDASWIDCHDKLVLPLSKENKVAHLLLHVPQAAQLAWTSGSIILVDASEPVSVLIPQMLLLMHKKWRCPEAPSGFLVWSEIVHKLLLGACVGLCQVCLTDLSDQTVG